MQVENNTTPVGPSYRMDFSSGSESGNMFLKAGKRLRQVCLGLSLFLKRGQKHPTMVNDHIDNTNSSGGMVGDFKLLLIS